MVGDNVKGVIVYVILEFCSYYGCILFCVEGLKVVGVSKVIVVMVDLNLVVSGCGL